MKRMSNVLVVAAMILGTLGGAGCSTSMDKSAQPETTPAPIAQSDTPAAQSDAPAAKDEAVTVVASTSARLPAPPALRVENPGPAPSAHHRWMQGYWRYDAPRTVYVWEPGFWVDATVAVPFAPPALRVEEPGCSPGAEYYFAPGFWRWSGREYVWVYGHWTRRADAGFYRQPRWENVNGHWQYRFERSDARRADDRRAEGDRRDDRRDDTVQRGDVTHRGDDVTHRDGGRTQGQGQAQQGHAQQGHAQQGHAQQGQAQQGNPGRTAAAHTTVTVTRPLPLGTGTKRGHA